VLRTRWNCAGHDSIESRLSVRIDQIGGEESVFAPLRIKGVGFDQPLQGGQLSLSRPNVASMIAYRNFSCVWWHAIWLRLITLGDGYRGLTGCRAIQEQKEKDDDAGASMA
jgi:hypothetical protein